MNSLLQQRCIVAATLLCFCAVADAAESPERKVEGNVLISDREPKVRIQLPNNVQYVGAERFELLGIADCELHAFVEADQQQNVRKLYWIQFEDYLPTKPNLKHHYDSPRHTTIGGLDFYVDMWARAVSDRVTPDSDLEHIQRLIRAKGFSLSAGMISVRLVHLLDDQKRKELMIIYSEDVASTGSSATDLKKGGKAFDQWKSIENDLIERAKSKIALEVPKES